MNSHHSDNNDTCMICLERIRFPCFFTKERNCKCMCSYNICVECCETYVSTFDSVNSIKCIICKHRIGDRKRYYLYNLNKAIELDNRYGDQIKCMNCDVVFKSRMKWYEHYYKCYDYTDSGVSCCVSCEVDYPNDTIHSHIAECAHIACNHCGNMYTLHTISDHIKQCQHIPRLCKYCHTYVSMHSTHIEVCDERPLSCRLCMGLYKRLDMPSHMDACRDNAIIRLTSELIHMKHKYNKLKRILGYKLR